MTDGSPLNLSGFGQRQRFGPQYSLGDSGATPWMPGWALPQTVPTQQYIQFPGLNLADWGGQGNLPLPVVLSGMTPFENTGGPAALPRAPDMSITVSDTGTPVEVDGVTWIVFDSGFAVVDNGDGSVTVTSSLTGASGSLSAAAPLLVTGSASFSSTVSLSLSCDTASSFTVSGGSLSLQAISVTPPAELGLLSGATVDAKGRVTALSRQFMGWYRLHAASRSSGDPYWTYVLKRQKAKASWPFMEDETTSDASNPLTISTAWNLQETGNSSSTVGGHDVSSVSGTGDIALDDYSGYFVSHAVLGHFVQVWKIGSEYFFDRPMHVYGTCT